MLCVDILPLNHGRSLTKLAGLAGFVQRVNECLRDDSGDSNKDTGQSGSGDEEMKAMVEESVVSAPTEAEQAQSSLTRAPAIRYHDPCIFHSYTAACAKGENCEYSHSIHADQVAAPEAKQRRGQARLRIKKRLNLHFAKANLYEVHQELQQEARQDAYAKQVIRRHLTGGPWYASYAAAPHATPAAPGAASGTWGASASSSHLWL